MALKKLAGILGRGARRAAEATAQEAARELAVQHREEIGQLLSRAHELSECTKDIPEALARLKRVEEKLDTLMDLLKGV